MKPICQSNRQCDLPNQKKKTDLSIPHAMFSTQMRVGVVGETDRGAEAPGRLLHVTTPPVQPDGVIAQ